MAENSVAVDPLRSFDAQERELGRQIHSRILSSSYRYSEEKTIKYVSRISRSLTEGITPPSESYPVFILYSARIYATSAPGGNIYITTGLINFLDNEAELAAVLAHEIGMLQYRDPRLSEGRKMLDNVTRGVAMVAPAFGQIGALAAMGMMIVHATTSEEELDVNERTLRADELAMKYLVRARYDPQGLIDLLYKLVTAGEKTLPAFYDYYQSRPISEERFSHINEVFQDLPLTGKTLTMNRQRFAEATRGIREIYRSPG